MNENCHELRIHKFLPLSYSNGPGKRAVIWTQGCSLKCPGCFNPETHPFEGGEIISVENLSKKIYALKDSIEGLTVSGGEPLEQAIPLAKLLSEIKKQTNLSVIILSGFEWDEIERAANQNLPDSPIFSRLTVNAVGVKMILELADVIIAGRYKHKLRISKQLRGSSNKTIHFLTNRYSHKDFDSLPEAEIIINSDGSLIVTGIKPPEIKP